MPVPPFISHPPRWTFIVTIAALLAMHAWIALGASRHKSTTNDEIAHITGGYTFNTFGDFRIQPENGVLPQRWHALPLAWTDPTFPDLTAAPWTQGLAYQVSYDFFYRSGNNPDALLFAGRAMNVWWGLATLVLIATATLRSFGPGAAIFTTSLAALSPTFLAHSALATSDMAMTFFFVATTMAFWRHLNRPTLATFALSSLTFSLACVAKFSAVMLLPMMAIMLVVRCCAGAIRSERDARQEAWPRLLGKLIVSMAGHGVVAVMVIWLFFGFQFSMMSPDVPAGAMPLAWADVLSAHPGWEPLIFGLRDFSILPEAFLYGFSYVLAFSLARGAFLDGQLGTEGWVEFFPKAFLYKTPTFELISLVLTLGVLMWWLRKKPAAAAAIIYRWVPGITLFVVYWAFSLTSNLNIGHRHILPTYPLLFIAGGSIIWWTYNYFQTSKTRRAAAALLGGGLIMGQAFSTAAIHPHHLAYFNPLSGGPARGYQHLVDSSLDWGQDLPGLARRLQEPESAATPNFLAYFGTGEPAHYGIDAEFIARLPNFDFAPTWVDLRPGTYAISATLLQHAYRQAHVPWSAESERTFQTLRNVESSFWAIEGQPQQHLELLGDASPAEWHHAWSVYSQLRFARLCEYLRLRPPDAMIGYSILVFELTGTELDQAVRGDLPALIQLIKDSANRPFEPEIY